MYRFQITRSDGKRVEHTMPIGLVGRIGDQEKDPWDEVDRQRLRETVNQFELPFEGKPRTYGQLCQHYIANELMEDQSEATIERPLPRSKPTSGIWCSASFPAGEDTLH